MITITIINYFSFYFSFYLLWLMHFYFYFCLSYLHFCTYPLSSMHFYFYSWSFNYSTSTSTSWLSISIYIICNDWINDRSLFLAKSLQNIAWINLTEFLVVRMELDALFCREKVVPYQQTPKRKTNPNVKYTKKDLKMIFLSWVLLSNDTLT